MESLSAFVFFALVLFVLGFAVFLNLHPREDRFSRARQQFIAATIEAADPKYRFDGSTARVIRELVDSSNGEATTYAITIYATNNEGEYFVFKSDGTSPTVKHLSHSLAQVILKHDYTSPSRGVAPAHQASTNHYP